jgi:hypothetical protein
VLVINDLKLIWKLMSTNLLGLEKIDCIAALTDMEIPHAEYLSSQAMNWLISFNNKDLVIGITD